MYLAYTTILILTEENLTIYELKYFIITLKMYNYGMNLYYHANILHLYYYYYKITHHIFLV